MEEYTSPPRPPSRPDYYQDGNRRPMIHQHNHPFYTGNHSFSSIWNHPSTPRPETRAFSSSLYYQQQQHHHQHQHQQQNPILQRRHYEYKYNPTVIITRPPSTKNWIRSPETPQLKPDYDDDDADKKSGNDSKRRQLDFPSVSSLSTSTPPFPTMGRIHRNHHQHDNADEKSGNDDNNKRRQVEYPPPQPLSRPPPFVTMASNLQQGSKEEMDEIFELCGKDKWSQVLELLQRTPGLAVTPITMGNNITTTVLHQAITKRGCKSERIKVIQHILAVTPQAVTIRNGYGSLPIHAIVQRNIGIDASTKESIIRKMVYAYPDSLAEPGGVGKRTPLHILFTGKFITSRRWIDSMMRTNRIDTNH
jgi:hypothetical protein